jgi:hypothetical protein
MLMRKLAPLPSSELNDGKEVEAENVGGGMLCSDCSMIGGAGMKKFMADSDGCVIDGRPRAALA